MLIQFSVENFMPFKNKVVLSLEPSKDKEHPENIINIGDFSAVKTIAIYGANASGKTSLFRAMTKAVNLIRNSNVIQVNQPLNFMPFEFDSNSRKKPSKFEFIFVAGDNNRYVYGFSADQFNIYEEYLYLYKSQRPTLIFERSEINNYTFKSQKSALEPLVRFNTSNKLFLATATNWNTECTKVPYEWLASYVDTFTEANSLMNMAIESYKGAKQADYLAFTEHLLKQADINISKVHIKVKTTKLEPQFGAVAPQLMINGQPVQQVIPYQEVIEVSTDHVIHDGDKTKVYKLNMNDESLGTNQLFLMGPFLKDAFENGKTVVIDEIDKSLHTFIVKYLIKLFSDKEINKGGAQLIFTTHDTSLLSLNTFRRDQIYFTEKNNENGISDLYSLDEFPVRKTENIEKGYLLGRYGAIPYIKGEAL